MKPYDFLPISISTIVLNVSIVFCFWNEIIVIHKCSLVLFESRYHCYMSPIEQGLLLDFLCKQLQHWLHHLFTVYLELTSNRKENDLVTGDLVQATYTAIFRLV